MFRTCVWILFVIEVSQLHSLSIKDLIESRNPKCGDDVIRPFWFTAPTCLQSLNRDVLAQPALTHQTSYANSSLSGLQTTCLETGASLRMTAFFNQSCTEFALASSEKRFSKMRWELWITPKVGTLQLLRLTLWHNVKGNGHVEMTLDHIGASVSIPPLYRVEQICSNSGSRQFVVAGPRSRECSIIWIKRGLLPNEMLLIANLLSEVLIQSLLQ